jgi:hypothetical protein
MLFIFRIDKLVTSNSQLVLNSTKAQAMFVNLLCVLQITRHLSPNEQKIIVPWIKHAPEKVRESLCHLSAAFQRTRLLDVHPRNAGG